MPASGKLNGKKIENVGAAFEGTSPLNNHVRPNLNFSNKFVPRESES